MRSVCFCWFDVLPGYREEFRACRFEKPPSYVVAGNKNEPCSGAETETGFSSITNVNETGRSTCLEGLVGLSVWSLRVEDDEKPGERTGSL